MLPWRFLDRAAYPGLHGPLGLTVGTVITTTEVGCCGARHRLPHHLHSGGPAGEAAAPFAGGTLQAGKLVCGKPRRLTDS